MSKKQALQELLNRKPSPLTQVQNTDKQENVNTEIQEYSDVVVKGANGKLESQTMKKKATFELEEDLHKKLKMYSAKEGKKMVEIVEQALKQYLDGKIL